MGRTVFNPILTLEVWHDYFLNPMEGSSSRSSDNLKQQLPAQYDISQAIALVPTAECQKALKQLRWIFRPQPFGGIVLAQIEAAATDSAAAQDNLVPFVEIDPRTRLTFWMVVRDRNFANYTNLSLQPGRDRIYYFSNQSNNHTDNTLYLTQPLKQYQPGEAYAIGDMVTHSPSGSNPALTLEAAISVSKASDPPATVSANPANFNPAVATTGDWIASLNCQYVSIQDRHQQQGITYSKTLARASPGDTLTLVDINQQESVVYRAPKDHPSNTDLKISLNLDQPPGRYQLFYQRSSSVTPQNTPAKELLGEFVLCDSMRSRQAFALVELSLDPVALSAPFRPLTQRSHQAPQIQRLQPKTYQIRFKNRATRWRYHLSRSSKEPVSSGFEVLNPKTFVTPHPLGFYLRPPKFPPKRLRDDNERSLPVPSPASPPTVEFADNSRRITDIFSDLYL